MKSLGMILLVTGFVGASAAMADGLKCQGLNAEDSILWSVEISFRVSRQGERTPRTFSLSTVKPFLGFVQRQKNDDIKATKTAAGNSRYAVFPTDLELEAMEDRFDTEFRDIDSAVLELPFYISNLVKTLPATEGSFYFTHHGAIEHLTAMTCYPFKVRN